ncbi:beta-1,3-galactosyltransferase 6 [Galendromus occidentalis]|uniref:Hexosyltransferase n=1 Tax=Galendromus occidentalis TaxID=34638 RepID=A0AAJ6VZE2_9ACAR|nr:beta-1,3-galactosyltransferase 6 [Galendromus occidentalis]
MARLHAQTQIGSWAIFLTLCVGRAIRNRKLHVIIACSLLVLLWTEARHRVLIDGPHTLCVAVFSAPTEASAACRQTARETWLSLDDGVRHYFFIGDQNLPPQVSEALSNENRNAGDVVLLPFVDSYRNLTLKLLHSIKYLVEKCDCKYILKADDDTFARVDLIVSELEVVKVEQRLYWGYFTGRAPIFRRGTWAETDWFLCDRYLPYARGGGYIFSHRVAKYIADNSPILQRYRSEDVSFGVWTAGLQLHRVHDPRFDTEYTSRGCLNSYLVTHKQSSSQMYEKMKNIRTKGRLCPKGEEGETRESYSYNWTVLPSQCCKPT